MLSLRRMLSAQLEHLQEQRRQRCKMAAAELRDGAEVGRIQRHNRHEVDTLDARLGDPARGVDADRIGIEQQRHHHGGVIGRLALLALVARHDRRKIKLLRDQRHYQARKMARRHKVMHRWRQQKSLI